MKKILLGLLLMPMIADAQHSIKLGLGGAYNSKPKVATQYDRGGLNPLASLSYSYTVKNKWEFGLSAELTKLSATQIGTYTQNGITTEDYKIKINMGKPVYAIGLFVNRHIKEFKKSYLSVGAYVGYLGLSGNEEVKREEINGKNYVVEYTDAGGSGFSLGMQFAYTRLVTSWLSCGVSVQPRYAQIHSPGYAARKADIDYSLFYMPTQLNLSYKF